MTLLVPYRDREIQLKLFIEHFLGCRVHIYVIEQADDKPFNRGKLINAGFLELHPPHFASHDVDILDIDVDYNSSGVVQLAKSDIQLVDYLGGVTLFDRFTFIRAGGYHNDFWHRAEDNEMRFNLRRKGIHVLNRFGIFKQLPHERTGPEFIPELWKKAQEPRTKNMLKTCDYKLISKEVKEGYTHLKVEL